MSGYESQQDEYMHNCSQLVVNMHSIEYLAERSSGTKWTKNLQRVSIYFTHVNPICVGH